ncbi:MAG: AlkZ family DNA glycosylase [Bauldia sp.]|nr:AlkZ family DNA glycosylase [Bauldia sp.]
MRKATAAASRPVLGHRALNRALLARQMLLERSNRSAIEAVDHLVGMQAQVPTDPYFALWSRLGAFAPADLSREIESRKAIRIANLRGTIHLVTARDALTLRILVQPVLTRLLQSTSFGKATRGVDTDAVVAAGRAALEGRPQTLAELRPMLAERFPGFDANALSYVFHYMTPLVQVPPRGLWGQGGLPKVATVESWLKKPTAMPDVAEVTRRYLAAFGPATVKDMQAWSGLTKLAPAFETLRPELVTFSDETGRELFDLPDAPRPDEDTPAPPRFLPVYDNLTLGFAHRERVLALAPPRAVPQNLNVRAFLIDGFVAGFWKIDEAKATATLTLEPFAKLAKKDQRALAEEGERLLAFAAPEASHDVRFGPVY